MYVMKQDPANIGHYRTIHSVQSRREGRSLIWKMASGHGAEQYEVWTNAEHREWEEKYIRPMYQQR